MGFHRLLGLDVRGPKMSAGIPFTGCPDKKGSLLVVSVRLWNEVLIWMSTTGGMFGGPYIPEPCGSVVLVWWYWLNTASLR